MFLPRYDCDHTIITCQGTNVSGHKRVWAKSCLGTNVSGHNRVWAQSCLGTIVSGHHRVWAQSFLGTIVWAQLCMDTIVWSPYVQRYLISQGCIQDWTMFISDTNRERYSYVFVFIYLRLIMFFCDEKISLSIIQM